jgi:hypothetical protein
MIAIALGGYVVMFAVVVAVFYAANKSQFPAPPSNECSFDSEEPISDDQQDRELV